MTTPAAFWDNIAEKYAAQPIKNMSAYQETLVRTRAYLSQDQGVLEIGCGTGTTALNLADDVGRYTASDFAGHMIAVANRKLETATVRNVTFLTAEVFDDAFQPQGYYVILAFNLLHLIEKPEDTLARVHTLLKPGGLFISKTVCLDGYKWFVPPMISVMRFFGRAPYVNLLSIRGLERRIASAGFEITETGLYPANPPNRFVVARKI